MAAFARDRRRDRRHGAGEARRLAAVPLPRQRAVHIQLPWPLRLQRPHVRPHPSDASFSVDPMAEGYRHLSPYAYCAGNPAVYVDKDGQVVGRVVVGAVVGAAINGGIALLSGESGREVLGAAARGAIEGGVAGLTFGMSMGTTLAGKIAVSAAVGAAHEHRIKTPSASLLRAAAWTPKLLATDAAVGAVTGGVMQKASSKLWNAREKTINNLSPSEYCWTSRKRE